MSDERIKDKILELLYNTKISHRVEQVSTIAQYINLDMERTHFLCSLMAKDGYIVYNSGGDDGACKIMNKGKVFFESGGYEGQKNLKILKNQKAETKAELENQQLRSVIETNRSVQETNKAISNNIPVQKMQTNVSIGVAIISLAFIVATVLNDCNDPTAKELKAIRNQLEEQTKETKRLNNNLEKMNTQKDLSKNDSIPN